MHSGLGAQNNGDANMAALHLMESLNSWQMNGGGAPPAASMGQRASMDGMTGMAGAPTVSRGSDSESWRHDPGCAGCPAEHYTPGVPWHCRSSGQLYGSNSWVAGGSGCCPPSLPLR